MIERYLLSVCPGFIGAFASGKEKSTEIECNGEWCRILEPVLRELAPSKGRIKIYLY